MKKQHQSDKKHSPTFKTIVRLKKKKKVQALNRHFFKGGITNSQASQEKGSAPLTVREMQTTVRFHLRFTPMSVVREQAM